MVQKELDMQTEQDELTQFLKEYQALCEKHQCQIIANPTLRARDDNTWSIVIQTGIGRLPKKDAQE